MNKKIRILLTDPEQKTAALAGELAYGCVMRRKDTDGKPGISCKTFLLGGSEIPVISMADPMAASTLQLLGRLTGGNEDLELAMIEIIDRKLAERALQIKNATEGGGQDARAEH